MRTVTVPLHVLHLLEPRVLGAFMLDFIHALPYEASQRAQVLLADLLTNRGPMLPPGTTPLEQMLGLATVETSPSAAEISDALARPGARTAAQLQKVADAAVEKAKGKRPSSRAVAQPASGGSPRTATGRSLRTWGDVYAEIRSAASTDQTVAEISKWNGVPRELVSKALQKLGGDATRLTDEGRAALGRSEYIHGGEESEKPLAQIEGDDEADDESVFDFVARQSATSTDPPTTKATRKRTSSAEVEERIRAAYDSGLRGVGLIAQSTGLGRTTVAAAVKRLQLEGVAG